MVAHVGRRHLEDTPADRSAAPADTSAGVSAVSPRLAYDLTVERKEFHDYVCACGHTAADDFAGPEKDLWGEKKADPKCSTALTLTRAETLAGGVFKSYIGSLFLLCFVAVFFCFVSV